MIRVKRLFRSFIHAFRGLNQTLREEQNLQIQGLVGLAVIVLGWYLEIKIWEWCILLLAIFIVILMEMINSAVERITDILKPRLDVYVKEIKDIMAAAVMLASLVAVVIGLIIFFPYFKLIL
jgi:diacylglycerol kinase